MEGGSSRPPSRDPAGIALGSLRQQTFKEIRLRLSRSALRRRKAPAILHVERFFAEARRASAAEFLDIESSPRGDEPESSTRPRSPPMAVVDPDGADVSSAHTGGEGCCDAQQKLYRLGDKRIREQLDVVVLEVSARGSAVVASEE